MKSKKFTNFLLKYIYLLERMAEQAHFVSDIGKLKDLKFKKRPIIA